jgi:hypothetical protein
MGGYVNMQSTLKENTTLLTLCCLWVLIFQQQKIIDWLKKFAESIIINDINN